MKSGFISLPILHAVSDLEYPTLFFLKRNSLFKFDTSILSLSVHEINPSFEHPIPINVNCLINSHPKAPAPTKKYLCFCYFSRISVLNTIVWSSYLELLVVLVTSPWGRDLKKSKCNHWVIGVYFPVNLTTSWATTHPKNAATGEILALADLLTLLNMAASNSSMVHAPSVPLSSSLILSALSRQACASSSVLDGSLPLFWWNLKTPWRAIWRTPGL